MSSIELSKFYIARSLTPGSFDMGTADEHLQSPIQTSTNEIQATNKSDPQLIVFTSWNEETKTGTAFVCSPQPPQPLPGHQNEWVALSPSLLLPGQKNDMLASETPNVLTSPTFVNIASKIMLRVHGPIPASIHTHHQDSQTDLRSPYLFNCARESKLSSRELPFLERSHVWFWTGRHLGQSPPSRDESDAIENIGTTTGIEVLKNLKPTLDCWSRRYRQQCGFSSPTSASEHDDDNDESGGEDDISMFTQIDIERWLEDAKKGNTLGPFDVILHM